MRKCLNVADLFAGAGGTSEGLVQVGLVVLREAPGMPPHVVVDSVVAESMPPRGL